MTRKPLKLIHIVKKFCSPILYWWNLKNWNSASTLLLKLMSMVALILAADFFLLKPNIVWDIKYLDQIDRDKIEETYSYKGKEIPVAVVDAIDNYLYSIDYNKQTGVILTNNYRIYEQIVPDGQFVFYLFDFLNNYNLSDEEQWFAWSAIRDSTITIGKITISNIGNAPASKIHVIPPPPYKLVDPETQPLDLPPSKSIMVLIDAGKKYDFSTEYFWGDNPGNHTNIVVVWDTSFGVVNNNLFIQLSVLTIVIWLTVIVRDIWFSKTD